MRLRVAIFSLLCLSVLQLPISAQQATPNSPQPLQRDASAITVAQQSLAAMGGAQALLVQDSLATGQVQSFRPDGTSVTFSVVKKSKGTKMIRTEVQRPEGIRLRVVNNGVGGILNPDGKTRPQFSNNTVAERVEHIPALSLLSDWQSSTIEIRYVREDTLNGNPVSVIALSYIPTSDPKLVNLWRTATQTFFYVDQTTSFVSKVENQNFAEGDSNYSEKIEVFYTNYRGVNGVQVPFTQTTYADGRLRSALTLTSITFNVGLSDSEFAVPGGN